MTNFRCFGQYLLATAALFSGVAAAAQVEVYPEVNHAVSAPLRDMAHESYAMGAPVVRPRLMVPGIQGDTSAAGEELAQLPAAIPIVRATPGVSALGLGKGFVGPQGRFTVNYAPPDTNAAVGATQVAETVNLSYAVFDKTSGAAVLGPISINNLFKNLGGTCSTTNLSDPVVLYDKLAGRWVVEIITTTSPYLYCMAVSTTSDATGSYNLYSFAEPGGLPDYAKVGTWPDAYYITSRLFSGGVSYKGPKACAVNRTAMLGGSAATIQCFQISNTQIDGMLPSDLDGTTAPPAGSPNFFIIQGQAGTNSLQLYKFHVDFAVPANSTFTGPTTLTVKAYTQAASQSSVPQSVTGTKLDALGNFLMHRLAYRNLPNVTPAHESLVLTHSVNVSSGTTKRFGVRWYELRDPNGTPVIYQSGTYSPDTTYRWMGSIATDKLGNIALGYSVSSSTMQPGIRYTGRWFSDPLGGLEMEAVVQTGAGSQTGGLTRWGDYTSMSVDPVDDCTMWFANEYLTANGSFNWSTKLFSFKFNNCH